MFQLPDPLRSPVFRLFLVLFLVTPAWSGASPFAAPSPNRAADTARQLQRVLDRVKSRLGLDQAVTVVVVPSNPHRVSVEAPAVRGAAFIVRVEERMLELLSTDEVEAALAHELGHVWVFTHHPYLQTEQGANEVAMRVVSRDALARVYEKVWQDSGAKGDLAAFLGAERALTAGGLRQQ